IGAVPTWFADDAEYAERRGMARDARRHRRAGDQRAIVVDRDALIGDRNDDLERTVGRLLDLVFAAQAGLRAPVPLAVPPRRLIAPPRSVLRPDQQPGPCALGSRQTNGEQRQNRRADRCGFCWRQSRVAATEPFWSLQKISEKYATHRMPQRKPTLDALYFRRRRYDALRLAVFVARGDPARGIGRRGRALRSPETAFFRIFLAVDRADMRRIPIEIRAADPELLFVCVEPFPQAFACKP